MVEIARSLPLHSLPLSPSQDLVVLRDDLFHYVKISCLKKEIVGTN
jgi:hypothetical protein